MAESLPQSVRYVKNGAGGRWWTAAKARGQLHCGWWFLPRDLLQRLDLQGIEAAIRENYKKPGAGTSDVNAIKSLIESPSQHLWVTFEEGYLWWCTVNDEITVNVDTLAPELEEALVRVPSPQFGERQKEALQFNGPRLPQNEP